MKTFKKVLKGLLISVTAISLLGVLFVGIYTASITTAPLDVDLLNSAHMSALYYDAFNSRLENRSRGKNANYVELEGLPDYVPNAFVAIEDKRFFRHDGLDYARIASAILENVRNGAYSQGASTISQQLIKNTHLNNDKNINRKIREAKLAYELESKYTKEQILELYINIIYFGNGTYGIDSAARFYFDKTASELSIGESATLAAIINSPSRYSPITNYHLAMERKNKVLDCMLTQGMISSEEYDDAFQEKILISTSDNDLYESYYLSAAANEVQDIMVKHNIKSLGGMKVLTYYDKELQSALVDAERLENPPMSDRLSMIVDNEQCSVSAVYGSSFQALSMRRQPGSTLKPLAVYAPALETGVITPDTVLNDSPIEIDGYRPNNYNKIHSGDMTATAALATSNNIIAVKVLSKVGIKYSKEFLAKNGLELDKRDSGYAIALGGITYGLSLKSLMQGYSTLARSGMFAYCGFVRQIIDSNGTLIYNHNKNATRAMTESTANTVLDMMKSTVRNGTAQRLGGYSFDIAAKTGTVGASCNNKNTDAYCIAVIDKYTIGSWIGATSNNNLLDKEISGGTFPTAIVSNIIGKIAEISCLCF